MKKLKLIALYCYICECYDTELSWHCQRFSPNSRPIFSDEECLCIYLYAMMEEEKYKIKSIYDYASRYLRSWFPDLPSYQAFNARINRLSVVFAPLIGRMVSDTPIDGVDWDVSLLDSMPIMTCSASRAGKIAPELTDKGYCATKKQYYYGLKLHSIAFRVSNALPLPEYLFLSPASVHDLIAAKSPLTQVKNRTVYTDKAYLDEAFNKKLQRENNTTLLSPKKHKKGQSQWERAFNKAADELWDKAVASIRQPIEGFFAFLIRKTDIQRASLVRSAKGLMTHIFGRIAAACAINVPKLNP